MVTLVHPAERMPKRHQRAVKYYTADVMMSDDTIHVITFEAESFVMAAGLAALAATEKQGDLVSMDQHDSEDAREYFLRAIL